MSRSFILPLIFLLSVQNILTADLNELVSTVGGPGSELRAEKHFCFNINRNKSNNYTYIREGFI